MTSSPSAPERLDQRHTRPEHAEVHVEQHDTGSQFEDPLQHLYAPTSAPPRRLRSRHTRARNASDSARSSWSSTIAMRSAGIGCESTSRAGAALIGAPAISTRGTSTRAGDAGRANGRTTVEISPTGRATGSAIGTTTTKRAPPPGRGSTQTSPPPRRIVEPAADVETQPGALVIGVARSMHASLEDELAAPCDRRQGRGLRRRRARNATIVASGHVDRQAPGT